MSVIRITKEFRFEGAHALQDYDGKCRHIHGHSYILYVTVKGRPVQDKNSRKNGMLMDFTDLKKTVNEHIINIFDHALILRGDAPLAEELCRAYRNVVLVDFQPTCENLICYFARTIRRYLPENAELFSLRLYETATSYVEWFAEDNKTEDSHE